MSRAAFRTALAVVVATFIAAAVTVAWGIREVPRYPERAHRGTGAVVEVKVSKGMKFPAVAGILAASHVIDRPLWFRIYAMHRGLANKAHTLSGLDAIVSAYTVRGHRIWVITEAGDNRATLLLLAGPARD